MSNDSGKWLPMNLDNSAHECRESMKGRDKRFQQPPKQVKQEKKQLTLEELDTRLQKVEKVLFGD